MEMPDHWKKAWAEYGYDDGACLCNDCPENETCPYAWDLYNQGDGCLGDK
jgi:hypothetical protein